MSPKGDSDLVESTTRLARRILGEYQEAVGKLAEAHGLSMPSVREAANRLFALHKRFGDMRTAKNLFGSVRPWDLERAPKEEIPASKRCKPAMFGALMRGRYAVSRYLFKSGEFKTQRGWGATCYDRKS